MISKSLYIRFFASAMILFIARSSYSQEIMFSDRMLINNNKINLSFSPSDIFNINGYNKPSLPIFTPDIPRITYSFKPEYYPNFYVDKSSLHKGEYNVYGPIKRNRHGILYGTGQQNNLIGIGTVNNATIGYMHSINDKLSINMQLNAVKAVFPYYNNQSFGTSGSISYRLNDNIKFNAFGSYYITTSSPLRMYDYGASMSFDVTERFGTEMGIRRHYNSMYGKWETIPIVMPYYKFNKIDLGIDVGGILYEVLNNWIK